MGNAFFDDWSCKARENRSFPLDENEIRRWYQKDIDQITHSIGFRKMQRKSQLLSEKDPRSRSRMIHTIEVSRIATEISEQLHLSKELTEAICLSHDIGTSPYGFIGNSFLSEKTSSKFSHETVGSIILLMLSKKPVDLHVDRVKIENLLTEINNEKEKGNSKAKRSLFPSLSFKGLDFPLYVSKKSTNDENDKPKNEYYMHTMSPEIIDGVLNHGASGKPQTLEGQVVQFADNIAYLSQDIEDLLTTNIIDETAFTKISQQNGTLCCITKNGKEFRRSWDYIDKQLDSVSLRDVFSESRGKRIAVLVKRFVEYNLRQLRSEK